MSPACVRWRRFAGTGSPRRFRGVATMHRRSTVRHGEFVADVPGSGVAALCVLIDRDR